MQVRGDRRARAARFCAAASMLRPTSSRLPAPWQVLGREFEEMCAQMYYRGKMFGFVHLYSGQEAVSTGARTQQGLICMHACMATLPAFLLA